MKWWVQILLHFGYVPTSGPLGPRAELVAARELRRKGLRLLARNLRLHTGEIDLLFRDPQSGQIVIVEVKAGTRDEPPPESHVNHAKQRKLITLAKELQRNPIYRETVIRFDVVGIVWPLDEKKPTRITHHPGAFKV